RNRGLAEDFFGRFDAIHFRHLDIGDHQVGVKRLALADQLAAVLGRGQNEVAQPWQDLLEVVAHVWLIIGHYDAQGLAHVLPRGKVITISAPRPESGEPTAIWPPWASIIRLAIAIPSPVPLVLVVKKGSKIRWRTSGFRPGPLSRTAMRRA